MIDGALSADEKNQNFGSPLAAGASNGMSVVGGVMGGVACEQGQEGFADAELEVDRECRVTGLRAGRRAALSLGKAHAGRDRTGSVDLACGRGAEVVTQAFE